MVLQKYCSGLIGLQLDPLIWETASPSTHKPKIFNESLKGTEDLQETQNDVKGFPKHNKTSVIN